MQTHTELQEYIEELKDSIRQKNQQLEDLKKKIVVAKGWKGKGKLEIEQTDTGWTLTEWRKEKDTGEVKSTNHYIPEVNITTFINLLKTDLAPKNTITYRTFVTKLIEYYKQQGKFPEDVDIENFMGGKNRASFYFPFYQWPARICESLGWIKYGGRGDITLK